MWFLALTLAHATNARVTFDDAGALHLIDGDRDTVIATTQWQLPEGATWQKRVRSVPAGATVDAFRSCRNGDESCENVEVTTAPDGSGASKIDWSTDWPTAQPAEATLVLDFAGPGELRTDSRRTSVPVDDVVIALPEHDLVISMPRVARVNGEVRFTDRPTATSEGNQVTITFEIPAPEPEVELPTRMELDPWFQVVPR